jgi:hypothetical protein
MMLYVCGDDISRVTLGFIGGDQAPLHFSVLPKAIPCTPEEYLGQVAAFLKLHHVTPQVLTGIVVVSSHGSATALRVSYALANAFGFAYGIPLYSVEKPADVPHEEMAARIPDHPLLVALPHYAGDAHVTVGKKDALKRRA